MESPRPGNVTWRLRLPARARAPPSQPRMSCHAGKVNRRCRTGNRTAKAPSGEKPPQGRIRCGAVRSPQSGLSRNNREIRALFAYFGVERAEFLCSSDCVAERQEFEPSFPFLRNDQRPTCQYFTGILTLRREPRGILGGRSQDKGVRFL